MWNAHMGSHPSRSTKLLTYASYGDSNSHTSKGTFADSVNMWEQGTDHVEEESGGRVEGEAASRVKPLPTELYGCELSGRFCIDYR
jgi:hypothetical protein